MAGDDLPIKSFASQNEWEAWLAAHVGDDRGIWLKMAKKNTGVTTVTYAEAVEIALCYGWIDGQLKSFDTTYFLQRFTPRRPKSVWSKINREKIEALLAAGRMQPTGLAAVAAAKADGRWDRAYDGSSTIQVPPDFQKLLDARPKAAAAFAALNKGARYSILWRIATAPSPKSRAVRIEKALGLLNAPPKA